MDVIIWKFVVKPGRESEFEQAYGSRGVWAELFRRCPGYLGTELLHDVAAPSCYVTIDRWESRAAYEAFLAEYEAEYAAIDKDCDSLTESESHVGAFLLLGASTSL
jgi:heme-degrading monooxygenase HmoA